MDNLSMNIIKTFSSTVKKITILIPMISLFFVTCDKDSNPFSPMIINPEASMPGDLTLEIPTVNTVLLNWVDNSDWETEYRVDRLVYYNGYMTQNDEWLNIARLDKNTTTFTDVGVPYDIFIEYRIYAYHDGMQSNYAIADCSIELIPPQNLGIDKIQDDALLITWANDHTWIDGIHIIRKIGDADWQALELLDPHENSWTDTGLDLSQTHLYQISSVYGEETSIALVTGYFAADMVLVEGGVFNMGNTFTEDGPSDEYPVHEVTLSGYYISRFEVTDMEHRMTNGYTFFNVNDISTIPAYYINWTEAVEFCNRKSDIDGLDPYYEKIGNSFYNGVTIIESANGYRLPTEAEWEFAARGGNLSMGYVHSGSDDFEEVGFSSYGNPIGQKAPNELGLYDMSGNQEEVVYDQYGPYPEDPQVNPTGPEDGDIVVIRGQNGGLSTISNRGYKSPHSSSSRNGFRYVRNIPVP